jgi:hypothetical protein
MLHLSKLRMCILTHVMETFLTVQTVRVFICHWASQRIYITHSTSSKSTGAVKQLTDSRNYSMGVIISKLCIVSGRVDGPSVNVFNGLGLDGRAIAQAVSR